MKKQINFQIGTRFLNDDYNSYKGISTKDKHKSDIIFVHDFGSGFTGQIIKCRWDYIYNNKTIHIDKVLSMFNFLPRKQKKQIKKYIAKIITNYKNNN
jgi:adenylate cyclase class IV